MSEELDEQIASYEHQLEILKKRKAEQHEEYLLSASNVMSNQSNLPRQNAHASMKPLIFGGTKAGEMAKSNAANDAFNKRDSVHVSERQLHQNLNITASAHTKKESSHLSSQRENIEMMGQRSIFKKQPSEVLIPEENKKPKPVENLNPVQSSPNFDSP